jgi:hypothetical protein
MPHTKHDCHAAADRNLSSQAASGVGKRIAQNTIGSRAPAFRYVLKNRAAMENRFERRNVRFGVIRVLVGTSASGAKRTFGKSAMSAKCQHATSRLQLGHLHTCPIG